MPLKIVQIIPDDRDIRHQFEVPQPFFGTAPTALLEGFAALSGEVEVHVVACTRRPAEAPDKLADNIYFHQVSVPGGYRRTLYAETVWKVRKCIREIDPDLVHGQGTEEYPALCAALSGYPNCVTVHGNMRAVARKRKYRPFPAMHIAAFFETVALSKTDAVVCLSSYTQRNVEKLAKRTIIIPNAVNSRFFQFAPNRQSPLVLLNIGTVVGYKNQLGLIKALEPLSDRYDFELRIVGGGDNNDPYVKQVDERCKKYTWCNRVGQVSRDGIMAELENNSILVHPSLEDNCPMVVLEAMAAGVPVAASAIGGIPDLIDDGRTGILFNPADTASITSAVEKLLSQPNEAEVLGRHAKQHAEACFSPRAIAERHLEFYKELLS